MAPEETDLERRVLAYKHILQALLVQLSQRDPDLLRGLTQQFVRSRDGAHEHEDTESEDYAEGFIHEVAELRLASNATRVEAERKGAREQAFDRQPLSRLDGPVLIRGEKRSGLWHVTRDGEFVGEYLAPQEAMRAAAALAVEVERRGGSAELVFGDAAQTV